VSKNVHITYGQELGRLNMLSTVILRLAPCERLIRGNKREVVYVKSNIQNHRYVVNVIKEPYQEILLMNPP